MAFVLQEISLCVTLQGDFVVAGVSKRMLGAKKPKLNLGYYSFSINL